MAKIIRIKNRAYKPGYYVDDETGERVDVPRRIADAEYAVITGHQIHARLKCNSGKWVAVERGDDTTFGLVVSPLNLTKWRALRKWALRKWGGVNGKED